MRTPEQEQLRYRGLTPAWIADDLGVSVEHVLNLIDAKKLEAVDLKIGSRPLYRVRRESYEAFLNQRKVA